jgi:uncharacterized protein (DUF1786 family)
MIIAYTILILLGLAALYCSIMMYSLRKSLKFMTILEKAGVEFLPVEIMRFVAEHPYYNYYIHRVFKFNKMMKEYIEENIKRG